MVGRLGRGGGGGGWEYICILCISLFYFSSEFEFEIFLGKKKRGGWDLWEGRKEGKEVILWKMFLERLFLEGSGCVETLTWMK